MAKGKGVLLNKNLSSFHKIKIYTDLHTGFFIWFCALPINDYIFELSPTH